MLGRIQWSLRRWRIALITVGPILGCGPATPVVATTTDDGRDDTTSGGPPITPPPASTTSTLPPDGDTAGDGIAFVDDPDFGSGIITGCSVLTQDCPAGFKCEPWANRPGYGWNDTRCSPIADDPGRPGDPCTTDGPLSGVDDCQLGAMCFDVDPETNTGTCTAHCVGDGGMPRCENPDERCLLTSSEVVFLCHPTCNPLVQDCGRGMGCYPIGDAWQCAPEARGAGGYGAPCLLINECAAGLICIFFGPAAVPGCTSDLCCTELCDLDAPSCTGAPEGQTCQPWYQLGHAPPGLEDVGACALPP